MSAATMAEQLNLSRFSAQMRALIGLATRMGWQAAHTQGGAVLLMTRPTGAGAAQTISVPPGATRDGFAVAGLNKALLYAPDEVLAAKVRRAREELGKRAKSPESLLRLYDLVANLDSVEKGEPAPMFLRDEREQPSALDMLDRVTAEIEQLPLQLAEAEADEAGIPPIAHEVRRYPRPYPTGGKTRGGTTGYYRDSPVLEMVEWSDGRKSLHCRICGDELGSPMQVGPHRRQRHPGAKPTSYTGQPMWQGPADLLARLDTTNETLAEALADLPNVIKQWEDRPASQQSAVASIAIGQPPAPEPPGDSVEPAPGRAAAQGPEPGSPPSDEDPARLLDAVRALLDGGESARLRDRVQQLEAELETERAARQQLREELDALGSMFDGLRGR